MNKLLSAILISVFFSFSSVSAIAGNEGTAVAEDYTNKACMTTHFDAVADATLNSLSMANVMHAKVSYKKANVAKNITQICVE